jgi:SAM-dependent methyltransferase
MDRRISRLPSLGDAPSLQAVFGDLSDSDWSWLNTEGSRRSRHVGSFLPGLPPEAIQLRFTGAKGDVTLNEGFGAYALFREIATAHGKSLHDCEGVLDFGCGWGRIIRYFLRDVPARRLWGIDCLTDAISWCEQTNHWCRFLVVPPLPPTSLETGSFDLVYSYSVFSHLSESAHALWLSEFARILRPGGLLIATTRGRDFISYCARLRSKGSRDAFAQGTVHAFLDTDQYLADFDAGRFCYSPVGGGDILEPSLFGETCIPRGYVLSRWTDRFQFVDYIEDRSRCPQNVIVVRGCGQP